MSVVIHVENCTDCPYFNSSANIPYCHHPKLKVRALPYIVVNHPPFRVPEKIPDFCPLESTEDYCESNFDIDRDFDNPADK